MAQETAGRLDIAELKRLHAAATQGEYFLLGDKNGTPRKRRLCSDMEQVYEVSSPGQCFWVGLFVSSADAQSFSALHNAFPALIARLEAAEAAMQWRPIEEAPKDVALRVGAWADDGEGGNRSWFSPSGWYEKNTAMKHGYTHYFIVPAPPEVGG